MRYINKQGLTDDVLAHRHLSPPVTSADAKRRWAKFKKYKERLRQQLLREQCGLCGYTEFNIEEFKALTHSTHHGCHLEHIEPKGTYPLRTFDYYNLIISVLDDKDLGKISKGLICSGEPGEDLKKSFAGPVKDNNYDPLLFVSPLSIFCEQYFTFIEESGEIVPVSTLSQNEQNKAVYMINLLNLNHSYLKNQRRKRMVEVVEVIDELDDEQDILGVIQAETSVCVGGQIASFPSAVKSLVSGA